MYWIALKPSSQDEHKLKQFRDSIYEQVDSDIYDIEPMPHITILPGFETSDLGYIKQLQNIFTPITVTFNNYHIWPSINNPMVVSLQPQKESKLEDLRGKSRQYVDQVGQLQYEPKPYHLTLFKGGDSGDESQFEATDHSIRTINSFKTEQRGLPVTITFDTLEISTWIS